MGGVGGLGDEVDVAGDAEALLLGLDGGDAAFQVREAGLDGGDVLAETLEFRLELVDQAGQGVQRGLVRGQPGLQVGAQAGQVVWR